MTNGCRRPVDCRHVCGHLERALLAAGERVVRVAPGLTEHSRRTVRQPGKSDPIDALAVARAAIREGIENLPAAVLDDDAIEIRVRCDYRDQLIGERTRLINRLRWHLVILDPELEASLAQSALDGPHAQEKVTRRLRRLPDGPRVRVAKAMLQRIVAICRQQRELHRELTALVTAHSPALLAEDGCGTVTAAIIIGHTGAAQPFKSDAAYARHCGTAPIPASSGNTVRHRLDRGGDRQLNRAIHIIAPCRAKNDPETRAYLAQPRREENQDRSDPLPQTTPRTPHPAHPHQQPHTNRSTLPSPASRSKTRTNSRASSDYVTPSMRTSAEWLGLFAG